MPFLKVGTENTSDINLYYEDLGTGKPVVLVHGWPLDGASWERQTTALLAAGYRVITYDRRGFGHSDKPSGGYDYNTLASDLSVLIDALDLNDAALFGFSMGGGEVARYMSKFDSGRVTSVGFISAITPDLKRTTENPEGVDPEVFETMKKNIIADRFAFLPTFFGQFYNKKLLGGTHVSDELIQHSTHVAGMASYGAMLYCIDAWLEDFRDDLATIQVPSLVIHGDADATLPFASTGERTPKFLPGKTELHVVEGGPHGCIWTHATEVNKTILSFLKAGPI
jgi:non-heme chloroperoxidase